MVPTAATTDALQFLQTAKVFRESESRNPKQAGLTKRRITEIVTMANHRYHDALDEIEVEIVRLRWLGLTLVARLLGMLTFISVASDSCHGARSTARGEATC